MDSKFHKIALPFEAAGPDGVIHLSFPDNGAGSGWAGFVQHIQLIAKLDPTEIAEMMSSEDGTKLLGDVEITGGKSGMDLLEDWDEAVKLEATPGRLTDEQYERYLRGESPDDEYNRTLQGDITLERVPAPKDK